MFYSYILPLHPTLQPSLSRHFIVLHHPPFPKQAVLPDSLPRYIPPSILEDACLPRSLCHKKIHIVSSSQLLSARFSLCFLGFHNFLKKFQVVTIKLCFNFFYALLVQPGIELISINALSIHGWVFLGFSPSDSNILFDVDSQAQKVTDYSALIVWGLMNSLAKVCLSLPHGRCNSSITTCVSLNQGS